METTNTIQVFTVYLKVLTDAEFLAVTGAGGQAEWVTSNTIAPIQTP